MHEEGGGMPKAFLWPHEVAEAIGVSAKTVTRCADAGLVEAIRDVYGRRRFRPEAIEILKAKLGLLRDSSTDGEAVTTDRGAA
jgi:hypothetical protein